MGSLRGIPATKALFIYHKGKWGIGGPRCIELSCSGGPAPADGIKSGLGNIGTGRAIGGKFMSTSSLAERTCGSGRIVDFRLGAYEGVVGNRRLLRK